MNKKAGILGVGSYLPKKVLNNSYFEKILDTNDEWIKTRTVISERKIADANESTSDLSVKAALKAMECANLQASEIDLIIVATATPDMAFPSTACSGFVYGLTIAKQFIETNCYKNILVIGAEVLSRVLDYTDRGTSILFGDGAGAVVIGKVNDSGILSTYLGADGRGKDFLNIPAGGSRLPASKSTVEDNLHTIKMAGNDVYKFAVRIMGDASIKAIEMAGLDTNDIDYLIPHQANIRIIEASAKRLKLSMDKVYVNLHKCGNMSAASIPVAMGEAYRSSKIKKGDNIVLVGFGGGLTWGASVIKWSI